MCGIKYFEMSQRYFPELCRSCIVMQNNWIVSTEVGLVVFEFDAKTHQGVSDFTNTKPSTQAKVYRFKEHHMCFMDEDGYYSSPTTKYITYCRPTTHPNGFTTEKKKAKYVS